MAGSPRTARRSSAASISPARRPPIRCTASSRLTIDGKARVVEYEPDSELRDTETVPLTEPGGIEAFIRREVLPHAPDAWIDEAKTTIGYEISFTRYFYKPQPLALAGRNPRRHPGARKRNRRPDGRDHRRRRPMIDGLHPYREAKASKPTVACRQCPAHWDVRRIKTLLRERDRRTETGEEPLLSLRMREGIVDHLAAGGKPLSNADLVGYKIVDCGMLVMNRMRASSGLFGVSPSRGLVSPDYAIFRSVSLVDTSYVLYLFKTPMLAQIFRAESRDSARERPAFYGSIRTGSD